MSERAHMTRPCENCPYRIDAPRKLWHRSEFEKVLRAEMPGELGKIFNCHKQKDLPQSERGFCAGWLLDQKKRSVPSVALRLALATEPDAGKAFDAVTGNGLRLFKSVVAMCKANGISERTIRVLSLPKCRLCPRRLSATESQRGAVCGRCRSRARRVRGA